MIYGGKELADAFRTVRKNTIQIAEDVPEEQYGFRAAADVWTVGEELAHIAVATWWQLQMHAIERKTFVTMEDFAGYMARAAGMEKELTTKAEIVDALGRNGDDFARFLDGIGDAQLKEMVGFPPPIQPPAKTRFEMLLGAKEHEMHHRGKLMLIERLLGIVPHLTRARQQRAASAAPAPAAAATAGAGA